MAATLQDNLLTDRLQLFLRLVPGAEPRWKVVMPSISNRNAMEGWQPFCVKVSLDLGKLESSSSVNCVENHVLISITYE